MIALEYDRLVRSRSTVDLARRSLEVADTLRAHAQAKPVAAATLQIQRATLAVAEEELRVMVDELARVNARAGHDRERYRRLFEGTPTPCLVTDPVGMIRELNPAASAQLEIEETLLRNTPLVHFLDPSDAPALRQALGNGLDSGSTTMHVRMRRRTGRTFAVILTGSLVDGNRRIFWIATPRPDEDAPDTHESSALRRALRDKEDLLARERRRREQLEVADKAKDRFLAILSHDLRGPIHATLGWTELLRREQLDTSARERALQTIERNTRVQLALVEELLDVSRIVADKLQLDMRIVDLALLGRRVLEAREPEAAKRNVTLHLSIAEGPFSVLADAKRIEQVVTNLIDNALKHVKEGGTIDVSLDREGKHGRLSVVDDGDGIAPDVLPHVFDCFRQGPRYSASRSGLGLGLYIVRQLLDLHGGSIRVESEGLGKGATFIATLPLRFEASPARESSRELPKPEGLEGLRILVVDDEADVRELLQMVLQQNGASVSVAASTDEAIRLCEALAPDVVVSDVAMPGEGGCELVRRLHASGVMLPTVAMSGFAGASDIEDAFAAGFDVHIAKPVSATELISAIHYAIDLHDQ